jgi:hypothetical protein
VNLQIACILLPTLCFLDVQGAPNRRGSSLLLGLDLDGTLVTPASGGRCCTSDCMTLTRSSYGLYDEQADFFSFVLWVLGTLAILGTGGCCTRLRCGVSWKHSFQRVRQRTLAVVKQHSNTMLCCRVHSRYLLQPAGGVNWQGMQLMNFV